MPDRICAGVGLVSVFGPGSTRKSDTTGALLNPNKVPNTYTDVSGREVASDPERHVARAQPGDAPNDEVDPFPVPYGQSVILPPRASPMRRQRSVPRLYSGGSAPGMRPTEYLPVGKPTGMHPDSKTMSTDGAPEGHAVRIAAPANVAGTDVAAAAGDATHANVWDAECSLATQSLEHADPDTIDSDTAAPAKSESMFIADNPAFEETTFDGFYQEPPDLVAHDRAVREAQGRGGTDGAAVTESSGRRSTHIAGIGEVDVYDDTHTDLRDAADAEDTRMAGMTIEV